MTQAITIIMTILLALIWVIVVLFSAGGKYPVTGLFWIAVIGTLVWMLWIRFKNRVEGSEKRKHEFD